MGSCYCWMGSLPCWVPSHAFPQHHSPGTEPAGSMVTRTEASRGTEPPTTRHTYSPESTGDTWYSLSSEPWVWWNGGEVRWGPRQDPCPYNLHPGLAL